MKKSHKWIFELVIVLILLFSCTVPAFAVTESEVEAQVAASSKEAVSGNLFVWFLCAIAFLKVSQKIDSFMSSLGINVGHTGGSMIAEAMIAARGISAVRGFSRGGVGGRGLRGGTGSSGTNEAAGFMSGGLAGVVSRHFGQGAVKTATGQSGGGIGGAMFHSSVEKGGAFANNVIGAVAKGSIASAGSMTGEQASKALTSYLGFANANESGMDAPAFSSVEIGGGRIMGIETTAENPNGIQFGMYNTEQYMAPDGSYSTVEAVDGSKWYKQYVQDTTERTPYMAPDGSIAYNESIVQKLPNIPRRKDRI